MAKGSAVVFFSAEGGSPKGLTVELFESEDRARAILFSRYYIPETGNKRRFSKGMGRWWAEICDVVIPNIAFENRRSADS